MRNRRADRLVDGTVEYAGAWVWHGNCKSRASTATAPTRDARRAPPTYTLGRRGIEADLVYDEAERARRGIGLYNVDRGGRTTYHGPGQLVAYPILELGKGMTFLPT